MSLGNNDRRPDVRQSVTNKRSLFRSYFDGKATPKTVLLQRLISSAMMHQVKVRFRRRSRVPCLCSERPFSALHVDGATYAAIGSNVCTAVEPEMLLDQYRPQHVIGVQFQRTAPERGLENMALMLARAEFAGLNQKPCPFQRQKNAT